MPAKKPENNENENKMKIIMEEMEQKNKYISELLETKQILERRVQELLARNPLSEKEEYIQRIAEDKEIEMSLAKELEITTIELSKKFEAIKADLDRFKTKFREVESRHSQIEQNYEKLISMMKKEE